MGIKLTHFKPLPCFMYLKKQVTLSLQENLFLDILRDFLSTEILKRFF